MTKLSALLNFPRGVRRYLGFARQVMRDLEWHNRYSGAEFPSKATRIVEQGRLLLRSAITGEDYYNHGLYRQSLSFEQKAAFLGCFEKGRYFDTINPRVYDVLARDKALFQILAASLGIPTPTTLATTTPHGKPWVGLRLDTEAEIRAFFADDYCQDIFVKPADGSLGEGALSLGTQISMTQTWHQLPTGNPITLDEVMAHLRPAGSLGRYLIQRRMRAHPEIAEIVPDVCPTVRLMTFTDNRPLILGAALRLGSGTGPTDNLSGGGVVAPIDLKSGTLGIAVNIDKGIPNRSEDHPLTRQRIAGRTIPQWPEVLAHAMEWATKLSFLPCIGWDIGVTDQGPIVVEINTHPRSRPVQIAHDFGILRSPMGAALARHNGTLHSGLVVTSDWG